MACRNTLRATMEGFLKQYEADFPGTCGQFAASMFPTGADQALVGRVRDSLCDGPPEIAIALLRGFGAYDMAGAMSRAGVPVRVVNADMMPTNLEGNRTLADFSAKIMTGVGHFPMLERPEEFNRLLRETLAELPGR